MTETPSGEGPQNTLSIPVDSNQRIKSRLKVQDVSTGSLTSEHVERTGHIADQIQGILENTYGIRDLRLDKASSYLWPKETSAAAEQRIHAHPNSSFYLSDRGFLYGEWWHGRKRTVYERARDKTKELALNKRLLPFDALQPVIYITPSVMARMDRVKLEEMTTPDKLPNLEVVAEEVGHFVYEQSQFKHNGHLPGKIMGEGMSIVDVYEVLKDTVLRSSGYTVFDPRNEAAKSAVKTLGDKVLRRLSLSLEDGSYNPFTSHYLKGTLIMRGYLEHLVRLDREGKTDPDLTDFYLMTGRQKAEYLINLYGEYIRQGDEVFTYPYEELKSRFEFESEFQPSYKY